MANICHVILCHDMMICHDMTICHDMRLTFNDETSQTISELLIHHGINLVY